MNSERAHWSLRFLKWICPGHLYEEIEGDLLEHYARDVRKLGERKAKSRFVRKVFTFVRPGIILRNTFAIRLTRGYMIGNYVKVMMRNLLRHKAYSAIHVFGLTTGICFALMIGVFIWGEIQINQKLADVDRLYLLESKYQKTAENNVWFAPAPLVKEAAILYPGLIENYYRFWDRQV